MKNICIAVFIGLFSLITQAKDITYQVNGKDYEGYFLLKNKKAPLVLLVHDWDGLTEYEKTRAQMLAKLGYSVFAADLFGKGVRPTEVKDRRQHTGELYEDRKKMRLLMSAALETAEKQGANGENAVVMGYCFGGAAVLEFARTGEKVQAFVTFHGGLETPKGQDYAKTKGQVVVFHGTADDTVTMNHFAALAKQLEQHKVNHEMTTYGGAPHAFTVFGTDRYRQEADEKSWQRFTEVLKKVTSR